MSFGKTLLEAAVHSRNLHYCPICSELGEESLLAISHIAKERTFEKGEFLMTEGEKCTGFFLTLSGKVRVYKSSSNGKEKVLLMAEKGMTFGEDGLFGNGTFLEMAVAVTQTKVLQIPRDNFMKILKNNPELSLQLMESLATWIRRLSSSVEEEVFLSSRDKAARYLLDLYQVHKSHRLMLPAKKKEIADQLGLAPETLSRAFHDFLEDGIIDIKKREIEIKDLEQLKSIANL